MVMDVMDVMDDKWMKKWPTFKNLNPHCFSSPF